MQTSDVPRFTRTPDDVAAEVVDGEAIIINLASGAYYSLNHAATVIWEALAAPRTIDEIAAMLTARFPLPHDRAVGDVHGFVADLHAEQLIHGTPPPSRIADGTAPASGAATPGPEYAGPALTKYTDMADMLALDPPLPGLKDLPWKSPDGD